MRIKKFFKLVFLETFGKIWFRWFSVSDTRVLKYEMSICMIFYQEAKFIKEWIDFHLTIGADHFYLYNNNSYDEYARVLVPYIQKGLVTLIDWADRPGQVSAYKHCLNSFSNESRWIAFIDADEFICPKYDFNIKNWISRRHKYPSLYIDWLQFGTNGILTHDYSKNVIEQYFSCEEDINTSGKFILNTRYHITNWDKSDCIHNPTVLASIFGIHIDVPTINQFFHFAHRIGPLNIGGGEREISFQFN